MRRVVVFGNSGSGKSTLAKRLAQGDGLAHLDLDTIAWKPSAPPERRALAASHADLARFVTANPTGWVVEGCYGDLLELALPMATEVVFLDLSVEECQDNARRRPWEPHKYESKEAQDANLKMLLEWIAAYETRTDTFSRASHRALFDGFSGEKRRVETHRG